MDRVKKKFGFYIIAGLCLLVSIFGISTASNFGAVNFYAAAEGEQNEQADKFDGMIHYDGETFDEALQIETDKSVLVENSYFSDNAEISLTATEEVLNDETVETKVSAVFENCYFENASLIFGAVSDVTFFN